MSASSQSSERDAVVVRDGELDRIDPREIGGVEHMLAPGPRLGLLAEQPRQRIVDRIERRDRGQPQRAAALSPAMRAGRRVDQREEHQPGILRDLLQDALEMRLGPHHRPEMAHRLDVVKLRERRLGDVLQRLAGRIRQQVEVEPHQPCGTDLWTTWGRAASATRATRQASRRRWTSRDPSTIAVHSARFRPQPVDNGDERDRIAAIAAASRRVKLLAIRDARISPAIQRANNHQHPLLDSSY